MSAPTQPDQPKRVTAPRGLGARGRRFWRETLSKMALSDAEKELVHEVCRTLDDLDRLHQRIDDDGLMVKGSQGQLVLHPGYAELRQGRALLAKLVAQLELPAEQTASLTGPLGLVSPQTPAVTSRKKSKAAQAAWRAHNAAKGS